MSLKNEFRVPQELHHLLKRWGRLGLTEGLPQISYARVSPCFREYQAPYPHPAEPPKYDLHDYDLMCELIDGNFKRPHQYILECYYRHGYGRRQTARLVKMNIETYQQTFEAIILRLNDLMNLEKGT